MAVLDTQAFDRFRRSFAGFRELLPHALAQRRCERVDLTDGRRCHTVIERRGV